MCLWNKENDRKMLYVNLLNFTDQGIKTYRETTKRAREFTKFVESKGGKFHHLLWTTGQYDLVAVAEFPDDDTAMAALLVLGSAGNVRTTTLRAFNAEDMDRIIALTG
jgi:uncharacterized protein with GYD domain